MQERIKRYNKYLQAKRLPRKLKKALRKDPQYTMHCLMGIATSSYAENVLPMLAKASSDIKERAGRRPPHNAI